MNDVLKRLVAARKALGISQTDAAREIGMKTSGFSQIERGLNPLSITRFRTLCHLYSVSEIEILTGIKPNFDAEEIYAKVQNMRVEASIILDTMQYKS